jgi:ABC-type nitrate/sulfonate/bicarbonate transport system permease component
VVAQSTRYAGTDTTHMAAPNIWTHRLLGVLGVVGVLTVMQLLVAGGAVSGSAMPTATDMIASVANLLVSRTFVLAVLDTIRSALIAFVVCMALAVPLGLLIGSNRHVEQATELTSQILRPIPAVAMLPIAILIFGIGTQMKVVLAAYAAFWPLLINTVQGVKATDKIMISAGKSFAWSPARIMWSIRLPYALPFIGTGMRLSVSLSLVISITAELLGAKSGIGQVVRAYSAAGRVDYVYAGIVISATLGLLLNVAVERLERRLMAWAPQYRTDSRSKLRPSTEEKRAVA